MAAALLTAETAGAYLAERGVVVGSAPAVELTGGVSNVVLAVGPYVIKQSLPQLRVADEWLAKRERILTEAAALEVVGGLTPTRVPRVVDVDATEYAITIESAPADWRNWKRVLLDERADPAVGAELGAVLGRWHAATWGDEAIAARFDDYEAFEQLRVDPYHLTVLARVPEAVQVADAVDELRSVRSCLVHGDYSPKNILVGDDGLWVLDFEVAHFGNPVFDVGFMLTHLVLTFLHVGRDDVRATGAAFWDAYVRELGRDRAPSEDRVVLHTACLCLARTDGKSLEDYLTDDERSRARAHALRLLDCGGGFDDLWDVA